MDNHVEIIEHDPLARWKTVYRRGPSPMIFAQPRFDFVRDCFELRLGTRRADHEKIGEAGNSREIENDDVFGFLI